MTAKGDLRTGDVLADNDRFDIGRDPTALLAHRFFYRGPGRT